MIGRGRDEVEGGDAGEDFDGGPQSSDASPWAGDSIPVGSGATEIEWSAAPGGDDPEFADQTGDGPAARTRTESPATSLDQNRVIGGVIAVIALLALGLVVLWPENDDGSGAPGIEEGHDRPPLDTLADTDDGTTDDPDDAATVDEATDDESAAEDAAQAAEDDKSADGGESSEILDAAAGEEASDGIPERIELPPALAAIEQPTEIVMVADDLVHTLAIPSGLLRTAGVSADALARSAPVVTGPDASIIPTVNSEMVIVPRSGPLIGVDLDVDGAQGSYVEGWFVREDGTTAFEVAAYGSSSNAEFIVDATGTVEPVDDPSETSTPYSGLDIDRANGQRIVNDAGGVYRIEPDGTAQRIATGFAFAANGDHLLLRQCDESLTCQFVVASAGSDEQRRVVDLEADTIDNVFGLDLSPDGTALLTLRQDGDAARRVIIDFDGGDIIGERSILFGPEGSTSWAPDSSGVFSVDTNGDGLRFLDRAGGESIEFATELGNVTSIGIRYPDSELVPQVTTRTASFTVTEPLGAATRLQLVVLGRLGVMARVDIDEGVAVSWTSPVLSGHGPPELYPTDDGVIALGSGVGDGFLARYGTATPLAPDTPALAAGGPRYPGPEPGLVWAPNSAEASPEVIDHRLVALDGTPLQDGPVEIVVPHGTLLGSDAAGGLVIEVGGDIFVATQDGQSRLTSGDLLAIGKNDALVRECDAELTCAVLIVDRATGERAPTVRGEDAASGTAVPITAERTAAVADSLSPDGSIALIQLPPSDDADEWAMIDLATGVARVGVPEPEPRQPIVWNADGTYAAFVSDDDVHLFESATGLVRAIEGLGAVRAIAGVSDEFRPDI